MSDYIEREAAEKRLFQRAEIANSAYIDQTPCQIMMLAQNVVHLVPAADVREVKWISVEERLPNEGEYVLIWVGNVQVAEIRKGISKKERAFMKSGLIPDRIVEGWSLSDGYQQYKRSESYREYDEDGNNLVPYHWYANGGPMSWFGQDVTHWMPLPEPPKEGEA